MKLPKRINDRVLQALLESAREEITLFGADNQGARERWLESTLAKAPNGSRILDAGAGELQYKRFCKHLDYVSQDFAQYDGAGNSSGLQTGTWDNSKLDIVSDICNIPEPDASFDAIMCIEVLEHVPYPVEALKELTRLLKPGGKLILTAPFASLTHFAPYFYQTGYSRYFYEYWLDQLGYRILEIEFNGSYFGWIAQELRRLPSIAEKYSQASFSQVEQTAVQILLRTLAGFAAHDNGSNQLLAYGLHVLAEKHN